MLNQASFRPLRVLLVTEPSGGGSGRHVIDLARELVTLGHEVTVIYSRGRVEPRFEREIAAIPLKALEASTMRRAVGPWDLAAARELKVMIDRLGPFDILHAHSSKAGALLRLVAPSKTRVVYTPHAFRTMDPTMGRAGRLVYGAIEWALAAWRTSAVISVAPEEADHARSLGIPDRKVRTVINGVTPVPANDRIVARGRLGIAPDDIVVGFVGRLCEQKDPVRFSQAIAIANARNPCIRGVILGDGELEADVRSAGGAAVQVHAGRNAVDDLAAFDLFAITSRYEAMPYVLLEALQAGLPILSTKVGGASVAIRDGQNGRVVPVNATPDRLAEEIERLVDPVVRTAMSDVSHQLATTLTAGAMAQQTVNVYRQCLAGRQ